MVSISEQIRQTLQIIENADSTTPCNWDDATHAFLFTQQDQDLFLAARNLHIPSYQAHEKQAAMVSVIKKELAGIDVVLRTRLPTPYVFGIILKNPQQKTQVESTLNLSVFKHKTIQKPNTTCAWDSDQNVFYFSKNDLTAFAQNWAIPNKMDDLSLSTECRLIMQEILTKAGIQKGQIKFFLNVKRPYYLGLLLADASLKDKVAQLLHLSC